MLQDIIIYSQIKNLRDLNCTMKPWHRGGELHRIESIPHPEEQKNQRGFLHPRILNIIVCLDIVSVLQMYIFVCVRRNL